MFGYRISSSWQDVFYTFNCTTVTYTNHTYLNKFTAFTITFTYTGLLNFASRSVFGGKEIESRRIALLLGRTPFWKGYTEQPSSAFVP